VMLGQPDRIEAELLAKRYLIHDSAKSLCPFVSRRG